MSNEIRLKLFHTEILILFFWSFQWLFFNVFSYDFIRYIFCICCEVPSRPHVPSLECLADFAILFHHPAATSSFQAFQQFTHRYLWRNGYQWMHMVLWDMSLDYVYIQSRTCLTNEFSYLLPDGSSIYRFPILGNPEMWYFRSYTECAVFRYFMTWLYWLKVENGLPVRQGF